MNAKAEVTALYIYPSKQLGIGEALLFGICHGLLGTKVETNTQSIWCNNGSTVGMKGSELAGGAEERQGRKALGIH